MLTAEFDAAVAAELERLRDPEYRRRRDELELKWGSAVRTDEERAERLRARLEDEAVFRCEECRRIFETGDVIHRRRVGGASNAWGSSWFYLSRCDDCLYPGELERRELPFPCAGGCGALISYEGFEHVTTCSPRCSKIADRERRRAHREPRTCEACGEAFTPKRSDAKFCSDACRQDAYRRRKSGGRA